MADLSGTNHWSEEHRALFFRERHHAVANITKLPFRQEHRTDSADRRREISKNKLCEACKQIISVIDRLLAEAIAAGRMKAHTIAMKYTLFDLHVSAELGCHLCSILEASSLRCIRNGKLSALEYDEEKLEDSWLHLRTVPSRMDGVRCSVTVGIINAKVLSDLGRELIFLPTQDFDRESQDENRLPSQISYSTDHDSTFEIVAESLRKCLETHTFCKPLRPPEPNVPRRLLQLHETTVQVVDNTENLSYACLSHRWGSQTNVPQELFNGDAYKVFEISSLRKTFRDAIEITKRLGLKHIWIDCFCILQYSKQDWLEQSAVMAQIYANSVFTIAALAAQDTNGGCFQKRNPLAMQTLRTDTLTVVPRFKDHLWKLEVDGLSVESSPLHTRAWVVQERLSSIRTIYYGACGVYWECRCIQASETHVTSVKDVTDNMKTMLSKLQAATRAPIEDSSQTGTEFLYRWQRLLEIYTICDLTCFGDKLIALSGITKDIEKYSGKQNIQGLWWDDISTELLWHRRNPTDVSTEVDGYHVVASDFPSWSWASMMGLIQYFGAAGRVIWRPQISVVENSDNKYLRLASWTRAVRLDDDGSLVIVDDGSSRGDLDESYLWYPDGKAPQQIPMEIILIQRILTSTNPFLSAVRCLIVQYINGNKYMRLGTVTIRFNNLRGDPFPEGNPPEGSHEVILA